MRTRVFDDTTITGSFPYLWVPTNGAPGYSSENWLHTTADRSHIMCDVVTPKFFELRNQGVIINNPLWHEDIHYLYGPTSVRVNWVKDGYVTGYMLWPYFSYLEIPLASPTLPNTVAFEQLFKQFEHLGDLAANRAWANVELSEAMLLASLGELPETLSWLRSLLTRGVNLTKLLRSKSKLLTTLPDLAKVVMSKDPRTLKKLARGSRSSKTDLVASFANAWLEYRYAIRPLIFEMKSCLEALKKIITKGTRETARGKEVVLENNTSIVTHTNSDIRTTTVTATYRRVVRTTISCRAGVLFQIEDDLDTLLAIWGIDQPLESAWELVPFSFIIDWFFSVGDTISAWSVNPSLKPLSSWMTFRHTTDESRTSLSFAMANKGGYVWSTPEVTHGKSGLVCSRTWRKPVAVRSALPRFDLKLDLAKIIDLGTIGRSLLSGKRPYQKGA